MQDLTELRVMILHYCVFDPEGRVTRVEMRNRYRGWCALSARVPVSPKMLGMTLRTFGVDGVSVLVNGKVVNGWRGVMFKDNVVPLKLGPHPLVPYVERDDGPVDVSEKRRRWSGPQKVT